MREQVRGSRRRTEAVSTSGNYEPDLDLLGVDCSFWFPHGFLEYPAVGHRISRIQGKDAPIETSMTAFRSAKLAPSSLAAHSDFGHNREKIWGHV
jgi:hypothetical protein